MILAAAAVACVCLMFVFRRVVCQRFCLFGVRVFCLMFVSHEDGGVQRSVWGSDDFDPLR